MTRTHPPRGRGGFTLVEMLLVLVIAGIMAALAGPSFVTWIRTITSRGAADQLATDLALARVQAVRNGQTASIRITDADTYVVTMDAADGSVARTLKTVHVADGQPGTTLAPAAGRVAFDSRGLLRGGLSTTQAITVSRGSVSRTVEISVVGRILRETR